MKRKDNSKEQAAKKAASLGINLKVGKKSSGKVLFPEKLEQANKILSNTKFRYVK
ncbi:MAG TPA: hypothetical protein VIL26_08845 [Clostridia bacterium]|jgi:hypothetical protein